MPEMPDLEVYAEHMEKRFGGARLAAIRLASPFLLRTVSPAIDDLVGREVVGVRRFGKQLLVELDDEFYIVLHLMIAGRLQWQPLGRTVPKRVGLVAFDFESTPVQAEAGSLTLTESSKKKRAALRLAQGRDSLDALHPGGLDVFDIDFEAFHQRLRETPHTVKRALTDQRVFAGIGNAYSDEILFHAKMSPFKLGRNMDEAEARTLFTACREVLTDWTARLREKTGERFPGQGARNRVTAFHDEMAVHGKYRQPCPVCGSPVQRIVRPENESNYCATCQTGGRLLADRSLSKLLKDTYPKRIEDLEA